MLTGVLLLQGELRVCDRGENYCPSRASTSTPLLINKRCGWGISLAVASYRPCPPPIHMQTLPQRDIPFNHALCCDALCQHTWTLQHTFAKHFDKRSLTPHKTHWCAPRLVAPFALSRACTFPPPGRCLSSCTSQHSSLSVPLVFPLSLSPRISFDHPCPVFLPPLSAHCNALAFAPARCCVAMRRRRRVCVRVCICLSLAVESLIHIDAVLRTAPLSSRARNGRGGAWRAGADKPASYPQGPGAEQKRRHWTTGPAAARWCR